MLETKGRLLASDIEAVGFYEVIHTKKDIHCLCSVDVVTDEVLLFHDTPQFDGWKVVDPYDGKTYIIPPRTGTLDEGIKFWEQAAKDGSKLIIHNCMTYDKPVIDKVWPDNEIPLEAYHDTFNQSKVQWYEMPTPKGAKSPHGLKAYGIRCGVNKPEVTDWKTMDAFKLHRVIEDCRIQKYTYKTLQKEASYLKEHYGMDFTQALGIEDLYAIECFKQEVDGAKVDVPYIKECIKDLDKKIELLTEEIEPQLPPTVKGDGGRVSRSEITEMLGYDASKVVDKLIEKKKNGEIVSEPEKPYYKPVVNIHSTKKTVKYQGYHTDHEFSPLFEKKKGFTDWRNTNYPDTKPKEWLVDKIEEEYVELKHNICSYFDCKPEDTDYVVGPYTKVTIKESTMTQAEVVKAFLIKLGLKDFEDWNLKTDVRDNKIKVDKETEVRWPRDAIPENQAVKIIPKGGYMVSSPSLSEGDYDQLPEGLGKKIAEYNTYQHRRRFLSNPKDPENKGLLSYVREDGRIPCGVNNFGTRSGRGSQRVWVNSPGKKSLYGKEIRQALIAEKGNHLVGADMKSAQLSIAAYYANNEEYYNNVATGEEFDKDKNYVGMTGHCVNARMFGMVSEEDWELAVRTQDKDLISKISVIRDNSKGGSFATLFGASGKKVAKTIGISENQGNARKNQFLDQMGLSKTIKKLAEFSKKYKYKRGYYLPLAFGYWLWNDSGHKDVNTIVQGNEALCQKLAVIRIAAQIKREGLTGKMWKVLDYHDEMLFEAVDGYEVRCGEMLGEAYTWAAYQVYKYHLKRPDHFANYSPPKFPIDLNGGYSIGKNYFECH